MADSPSLIKQLSNRARLFHSNTNIPQSMIAKAIGTEQSNYSAFLAGNRGVSAESTCKLLNLMSLTKEQAVAKFYKPSPTSRIMLLQQNGQKMRMDDSGGSWVPGLVGVDPSIGGSIIDPPDDGPTDADLDMLRRVRRIHRQAIRLINNFSNTAKQAKVNRDGPTEPTDQRFARRG